jgi:hypothetical protein
MLKKFLNENFNDTIEIIMKIKSFLSSLVCLNCLSNNEYELFNELKTEVHKLFIREFINHKSNVSIIFEIIIMKI